MSKKEDVIESSYVQFACENIISIIKTECYEYPCGAPNFRPSELYPELLFSNDLSKGKNEVYAAVRESFYLLGLDEKNYGTAEWNPLGEYIQPGNTVLIKPNLVREINLNSEGGTDCIYTNPAVVAPVIDYILIALKGKGNIVIGDAPVQECNFDKLIENSGYMEMIDWYSVRGYEIQLVDFRAVKSTIKHGVQFYRFDDFASGKVIDLGKESAFYGMDQTIIDRFRITNYDPAIMKQHHTENKHEYYISDYMLDADCIINMPKPKSHRKAGVTLSLKNMVGINVRKEYLPHHTMGSIDEGGDEYKRKNIVHSLRSTLWDKRNSVSAQKKYKIAYIYWIFIRACSLLLKMSGKDYSEGSWYGNHTISKTIADLNKIVFYADKNGELQSTPQRKMIIVADMIISGEGEGPLKPSPKKVGMIVSGTNPISFDKSICHIMGFNPQKIPTFADLKNMGAFYSDGQLNTPCFRSNSTLYDGLTVSELKKDAILNFIPASGWKGAIEIENNG